MGLSIFSFDLAALINKLSNIGSGPEISPADLPPPPMSPAQTDEILNAVETTTEAIIEDILLATTVSNAAISLISPDEILKRETAASKPATAKPAATVGLNPPDEEYRKIIEQLIRSLQTSVIHSYQSADLINETVSLKTVANTPRRNSFAPAEDAADEIADEKKRKEAQFRELREELKKAMLRNNSNARHV